MRRHAGPRARATGSGIGRSHVRISAVIDVEKRALRAFEQNLLPSLKRAMQINDRVCDKRPQLFAGGEISLVDFAVVDRLCPERLENAVVLADLRLQFLCEQDRLHQIGNPQTGARCFIAISRADSAFGRSNFRAAFS
jgi:hypothetical protein